MFEFSPKDPDEQPGIVFDYSNLAPLPSAASVNVYSLSGSTLTPTTDMTATEPTISGSEVYFLIAGGKAGTRYVLEVRASHNGELYIDRASIRVEWADGLRIAS